MTEPVEGIQLGVTNHLGWSPLERTPLIPLEPGFSKSLGQIAHDLVREQIENDLRLARMDLGHARGRIAGLEASVAQLEAALAELGGEP